MGLSNEFISFAKNVQNKLEKDPIHNTKLSQYNSKVYMAGKHTWQPIQCVVRDDVDGNVIKAIGSQLQNQIDHIKKVIQRDLIICNTFSKQNIASLDFSNLNKTTPRLLCALS